MWQQRGTRQPRWIRYADHPDHGSRNGPAALAEHLRFSRRLAGAWTTGRAFAGNPEPSWNRKPAACAHSGLSWQYHDQRPGQSMPDVRELLDAEHSAKPPVCDG